MKVEVSKLLLVKVIAWPLEKSIGSVCSRLLDDEELTRTVPTVLASELEFFDDTIGTMLDATLNEELTTEAELETAPIKLPVEAVPAAPGATVHPVPLVKSKI